jgi:hypothetical protein
MNREFSREDGVSHCPLSLAMEARVIKIFVLHSHCEDCRDQESQASLRISHFALTAYLSPSFTAATAAAFMEIWIIYVVPFASRHISSNNIVVRVRLYELVVETRN